MTFQCIPEKFHHPLKMDPKMRLINLTERDQFILIEGKRTLLPSMQKPVIISKLDPDSTNNVSFESEDGSFMLEVGKPQAEHTFSLPAPKEGTIFLVETSTMVQFPDRKDFVTPHSYGRAPKEPGSTSARRSYLRSVRTSTAVSDPSLKKLQMEDFTPFEELADKSSGG